jgi:hypothetical protein
VSRRSGWCALPLVLIDAADGPDALLCSRLTLDKTKARD